MNILENNYLVQPYAVGKDKRSLALVIPAKIVKALNIDPLSIFLSLRINGMNDLQIHIIRQEDLAKKSSENMLPAEKISSLTQQVPSSVV